MSNILKNENVIKKIQLAKALFENGNNCFSVSNDSVKIAIGIVLIQDSIEIFLIAINEAYNNRVRKDGKDPSFNDYINSLEENQKIIIPFREKIRALNRQRINIKHYGVLPNPSDFKESSLTIASFFDQMCMLCFNESFQSISLVDLLSEGKTKALLKKAESFLKENNAFTSLVFCSMAFYFEFEVDYDARVFECDDGGKTFDRICSKVPEYAKQEEFFEKFVNEPTDYIVLDRQAIEQELIRDGISVVDFWNVWRLTPKVYYYKEKNKWAIEKDCQVNYSRENAEYCFNELIKALLIKQRNHNSIRGDRMSTARIWLKAGEIIMYSKASMDSEISCKYNFNGESAFTFKKVDGFDFKEYYHVVGDPEKIEQRDVFGYVLRDQVEKVENINSE